MSMWTRKMQDAGEMIGKIVIGEIAVGYGLTEAIDIISSGLADFISFTGLGIALLIALGLRFVAGGLYALLRARSIDVADSSVRELSENEVILQKKSMPHLAWLLRQLKKTRLLKLLKALRQKIVGGLKKRKVQRVKKVASGAKSSAKSAKVKAKTKATVKKTKAKTKTKKAAKSVKKAASAKGKAVYAKHQKLQLKQAAKHLSSIKGKAKQAYSKLVKAVGYAFAVTAGKYTTIHFKKQESRHKRASHLAKHLHAKSTKSDHQKKDTGQHKGFFQKAAVTQHAAKAAFKASSSVPAAQAAS